MRLRSIPAGIAALVVALAVGFAFEMRGTSGDQPADSDDQPRPHMAGALPRGDRLDAARRGDRLDAAQRRRDTAAFTARFGNAFAARAADLSDEATNDQATNDTGPAPAAARTRAAVARGTASERVAAAPTRSIFPPEKQTHLVSLGSNDAANDEAPNDSALAYAPSQAPAPTRSIVPPEKHARVASLEPTAPASAPATPPPASPAIPDLDGHTAIYDISAHTIYLPDGEKLEAHSGLGSHVDDPHSASLHNRGATPPNVYRLTLREHLFHGVRALRMIPVGDGKMYGRDGILAHTYMLGPRGQSNGCMVVRNYTAFLEAFLNGKVERLVVVGHLDKSDPRLAALH